MRQGVVDNNNPKDGPSLQWLSAGRGAVRGGCRPRLALRRRGGPALAGGVAFSNLTRKRYSIIHHLLRLCTLFTTKPPLRPIFVSRTAKSADQLRTVSGAPPSRIAWRDHVHSHFGMGGRQMGSSLLHSTLRDHRSPRFLGRRNEIFVAHVVRAALLQPYGDCFCPTAPDARHPSRPQPLSRRFLRWKSAAELSAGNFYAIS